MAKFCKYCGTALEDGQICSCPQAQAEAAQMQQSATPPQQPVGYQQPGPAAPPQQPAAPQYAPNVPPAQPKAPSPIAIAFQNLLPYLKAYVASPANATTTALRQKDIFLPVILLAIQAIVSGLVMFSAIAKVCGMLNSLIAPLASLSSLFSAPSSGISAAVAAPSINASFFMCLIFGFLTSVVCAAIFVVLAFVVAKLCGSDCTVLDMLIICGSNAPFVIVLMLLSFLLFFLSIPLGMGLFLFAMVAWIVLSSACIQAVTPNTATGKFWIFTIVAAFLTLILGCWIGSALFSASVGATTIKYMGNSISLNDLMKSAKEVDFGDTLTSFFQRLIRDMF